MTPVSAPTLRPLGPHASARTTAPSLSWTIAVRRWRSHSRIVPRASPLARCTPIGRERHPAHPAVRPSRVAMGWPLATSHSAPCCRIRRWRCVPVGRERHPRPGAMAFERGRQLAAGGVPQAHRPVVAGAGEVSAVGRERHARSPVRCGLRGWRSPAAGDVPQPHRPVVAGAGEVRPSGANATAVTPGRRGLWSVAMGWPLAASHTRAVPSSRRWRGGARRARRPPRSPCRCGLRGWR